MSNSKNSLYYVHVAIVVVLMFLFRYIPAPAPITPYGMHVLGIFIGLVYGWSLCGLAWPSVLALVALGISDYGITETVFASVWGQAGLILMLFGFMLFAPLSESGLTEALGYKLLSIKVIQAGRPSGPEPGWQKLRCRRWRIRRNTQRCPRLRRRPARA